MASFLKPRFSILLLLVALLGSFASFARILDEADPAALAPVPPTTPTITPPGGAIIPNPAQGTAATSSIPAGNADPAALAPVPPTTPITPAGTSVPATSAIPAGNADPTSLTFFMHDILGGSRPSAIAVTGIVANPSVGGQVPFARPNGAVLPAGNNNNNNNNNNNVPFLTGLSGFPTNLIQTNNNNNNNNGNGFIGGGGAGFPVLNSAQFPSGTTLQKLMFGTMTVFDDELTEGRELQGSGLVGKAQGFYIASSEDGSSLTMAFTVMFASGRYEDSLSFFGVHRTAVAESQLAVMGGTGKYVGAKGFATAKTFPAGNHGETDGVETLLEITVDLAY